MKLSITFISTLLSYSLIFGSALTFSPDIDGGRVVQIRTSKHRVRRDVRAVTFEIDDKDYHFNFEYSKRPVYSNDIPVYLIKSKPGGTPNYTYERVPNTERMLNGHYYVDNARRAVAYVNYDEKNGEIMYNGLFGENANVHLIKSLSETQKYKLQSEREQGNHIINKIPRREPYVLSSGKQEKRTERSYERYVDYLNEKLAKPLDVLHPKLLVLVDSGIFKYHNNDITTTLQYVATFWNAVDQKYVELDATNIQLLVTGVVIAEDENAFNFVQQGKLDPVQYGENRYHADYILEHMRMYFHYNFSNDVDFQNFDAAVVMTSVDTRPTGGVTQLGKICSNWYNDIVVRDEGWFDAVHAATHELAHALGARHDSYKQPGECQSHDNNNGVSVMSPIGDSGDYFYWSDCTKRYLRDFSGTKAAKCLATRHRERHFDESFRW